MCLPVSLHVCPHLYTDRMHKLNVDQINSFHYWRVSIQLMSGGAQHQDEPGMSDRLQQWKINWFWTFHCVCCIFCFIYLTVYISSNNRDIHISGTVQQASSSGSRKNTVTHKQTRLLSQMFLQPQEIPRSLLFSTSPAKSALYVKSSGLCHCHQPKWGSWSPRAGKHEWKRELVHSKQSVIGWHERCLWLVIYFATLAIYRVRAPAILGI